jgi:hypothetical protein
VRVDPTAFVAPSRIGTLQRLEAPRGVIGNTLGAFSPRLRVNLRALWEAANNGWNQWILNYTQSRQLNLLKDLGFDSPSWEDLGLVLIACIVLASLSGAAWTLWEHRRHDPWLRLLLAAQQRLRKAGLAVTTGSTPRALAEQLEQTPKVAEPQRRALRDWLLRLEAWRYAPASAAQAGADLTVLKREFKRLNWPV